MTKDRTLSPLSAIQDFLKLESAAGVLLVGAMLLALIAANSPLAGLYDTFLDVPVEIRLGKLEVAKPLLLWINDGLMAVFFLLVGLEIKREMLEGELSTSAQAALPAIAALGGMAVPAGIYAFINWGDEVAIRGWAIPSATDIAFSLGVLSLLGARVPLALKVFLTALAILDDLGGIIIIAIFYTEQLAATALGLALAGIAVLILLNRLGVRRLAPYVLIGIFIWVSVLKSGVHATLAGVALGMAIPLGDAEDSPLRRVEHALHPWVAYAILPLFAFANAGVSLAGVGLGLLADPVFLGIALGLFIGKQVGVFAAAGIAVKLGLAPMPGGASWGQLYGVALLTGIGFTMSLFIGSLAFEGLGHGTETRLGVLAGSVLSALLGYLVLRLAPATARNADPTDRQS